MSLEEQNLLEESWDSESVDSESGDLESIDSDDSYISCSPYYFPGFDMSMIFESSSYTNEGIVRMVRQFLKNGGDPNLVFGSSEPKHLLLHISEKVYGPGCIKLVKLLIKYGADLNVIGPNGNTALTNFILRPLYYIGVDLFKINTIDMTDYFLRPYRYVNFKEYIDGSDYLSRPSRFIFNKYIEDAYFEYDGDCIEEIKLLLSNGASTLGISEELIKVIEETLRDSNANPNATANAKSNTNSVSEKWSLFNRIVETRRSEQVDNDLIEQFDDQVEDQVDDQVDGTNNALITAFKGFEYSNYKVSTLKKFLEEGGNPNISFGSYEIKPIILHISDRIYGPECIELLKLLIEYGADLNITGPNGTTALVDFVSRFDYYIETKEYIDSTDTDFGDDKECIEAINLLLSHGASTLGISEELMESIKNNIERYYYNRPIEERDLFAKLNFTRINEQYDNELMEQLQDKVDEKTNALIRAFSCQEHYKSRVSILKKYLEEGGDPDFSFECGNYWPEHIIVCAIRYIFGPECIELVKLLIDYGANLNASNPNGNTALGCFVERVVINISGKMGEYGEYGDDIETMECIEGIQILLSHGASTLTISEELMKSLEDILDKYYHYNSDLLSKEWDLFNMLVDARKSEQLVANLYLEQLQIFTDYDFPQNKETRRSRIFSEDDWYYSDKVRILEEFLSKGGDPNHIFGSFQRKPLLLHVSNTFGPECIKLLNLLIKYGANLDITDSDGTTALENFVGRLEYCVEMKVHNSSSETDLEDPECFEAIHILLSNGANPRKVSKILIKLSEEALNVYKGNDSKIVSVERNL